MVRFWTALDDLHGAATDARQWQEILGEEFSRAAIFLQPTGKLAEHLSCPSPGGEGCPRRVVIHDDGSVRAVCGDRLKACADLDLTRDDVKILGLNRRALIRAVAKALDLSGPPDRPLTGPVVHVGAHEVFTGVGFPVFLTIPGPAVGDDPTSYLAAIRGPGPRLLLTPTRRSLPDNVAAVLDHAGVTRLALADILPVMNGRGFLPLQPPEHLFADLRAKTGQSVDTSPTGPVWKLPPGAQWEKMTIGFISEEVINVRFGDQIRRFEPAALGMQNRKNGKPTMAWEFLKLLAKHHGRLPLHTSKPQQTAGHQKRKQALSKALRSTFGMSDDPIGVQGREYVTRFVIHADDLRQGKKGQSQRNFVGPS